MIHQASDASGREGQLQDLLVAYLEAVEAGQAPPREVWLARHPEFAAELAEFFASRDALDGLAPLREVARAAAGTPPGPDSGDGSPEPAPATADGLPGLGRLGDFHLVREVGRGGMGVVYEAEQLSLRRRRVALKVLPLVATMDAQRLQRFQNEAQTAACLHHGNIVPVYAVGCERGVHFYAMQYIEGQSLAAVIRNLRRQAGKEPPPPGPTTPADEPAPAADPQRTTDHAPAVPASPAAETPTPPVGALSTVHGTNSREFFRAAAQLGIQAAEALDHAHGVGVVHRDIKPANLMLDGYGKLWVTDFGLAHVQSEASLTATGDLVGTLRYMSPEQALAKRVPIDHRTDVYSLGATLYELLTLERAFDGRDRQELLRQVAFEEPRPPRRVSRAVPVELETIVLKALEKNPAERYGTAQELADDLRHWLEDRPIQARRPTVLQRLRKWRQRHWVPVTAAAVCLLVTISALMGSIGWVVHEWQGRRDDAERRAGEALQRADAFLQQEKWQEGLRAVELAEGFLAACGEETGTRVQARQLRRELRMGEQLQEAQLRETGSADGGFDSGARDAAYAAAFQEYGLNVDGLDAQVAGEQVRARPIHGQLVAALDAWASIRKSRKQEGWQHRLAVARAADSNLWRNRLRNFLEGRDPKALEELAAADLPDDCPTPTLVLLGRLAARTPSGEQIGLALMQAQQRHPGDFWLNETLAMILMNSQPPRLQEAIRFHSIAVALRPQSSAAHSNLGIALHDACRLEEAIAEQRQATRLDQDEPVFHNNLGSALSDKGQLDEAIAECREAIRLKPHMFEAHANLGLALYAKGLVDEAMGAYREALRLRNDAKVHFHLGIALANKGRMDDAMAEYREAIALKQDFPAAHSNLGLALKDKGQLDGAIAEYRMAIESKQDFPEAYKVRHNLGDALRAKGQLDEAITEHREVLRVKKDSPEAHRSLGAALGEKGQLDEAMTQFREALRLEKDFPMAHHDLGYALKCKGRLDEAIAEYREAIRLKPDYPEARNDLGNALILKGQLDEAIAEYREAIRIKMDFAVAHNNLGNALNSKGQLDDAIAEYRAALRLKPDYPEARNNLGVTLKDEGRLDEAIAEFREAIRLYPNYVGARNNLRLAEQLARLDKRLPAILQGKEEPANAAERVAFAQLCQLYRKQYTAAARFYKDAFTADPGLAEKLGEEASRYDAACAAALAGCGQGEDAKSLDDKERARLRRQALDWLRADLAAWQKLLEKGQDQARAAAAQQLGHWLEDTDFAGVRGPEALGKLPEAERADWQKLWQEVEALRQRAARPPDKAAASRP